MSALAVFRQKEHAFVVRFFGKNQVEGFFTVPQLHWLYAARSDGGPVTQSFFASSLEDFVRKVEPFVRPRLGEAPPDAKRVWRDTDSENGPQYHSRFGPIDVWLTWISDREDEVGWTSGKWFLEIDGGSGLRLQNVSGDIDADAEAIAAADEYLDKTFVTQVVIWDG